MTVDDLGAGRALFELYRSRLYANGWKQSRSLSYGYAERDGLPLSKPVRALYGRTFLESLSPQDLDSFDLEQLCRQPAEGYYKFPGLPLNKLCAQIFEMHPNLRSRYAINTPLGRLRYRMWLKRRAVSQFGIPPKLLR